MKSYIFNIESFSWCENFGIEDIFTGKINLTDESDLVFFSEEENGYVAMPHLSLKTEREESPFGMKMNFILTSKKVHTPIEKLVCYSNKLNKRIFVLNNVSQQNDR
jgi:hypothetical protein